MLNFLKHIAVLLLGMMMASCSSTVEEGSVPQSSEKVSFVFQLLSGGETLSTSRAKTDIGTNFDSKIKKGTLHIFIYAGQQLLGEVEQLKYYPEQDLSGGVTSYFVQGFSPVLLKPGLTYRLLVVANVAKPLELNGEGSFYDRDVLHYPDGYIPLWGMTTHVADHHPVQYLSPVTLMRGSSKVVVRLADSLKQKGYELRKVELNKVATRGYVFPKRWQEVGFTNELMDIQDYFHPCFSVPDSKNVTFQQEDAHTHFLYLPEYDNLGTDGAASISLTIAQKESEEHYEGAIEFKNYREGEAQTGTLQNIVRNHIYEYTIQNVEMGHHLSLESHVQPWSIEEETWDYTDHVTVRTEGKMQWLKDTYQRIDRETGSVVMIPGSPMVCTFQIDTPKEAVWYASFIPVSGVVDAFEFETYRINDGKNATGDVGKPVTLHIRSVKPALEENNVALLRIVVITKGGRTILVKNLLPDEFQKVMEYKIVLSK